MLSDLVSAGFSEEFLLHKLSWFEFEELWASEVRRRGRFFASFAAAVQAGFTGGKKLNQFMKSQYEVGIKIDEVMGVHKNKNATDFFVGLCASGLRWKKRG